MRTFRHAVLPVSLLAILLLIAACGSAASSGSSNTASASGASNPTPTPTTSSSGYNYPTPTATASVPTPTPAAASSGSTAIITTASATVKGQTMTILTSTQGKTLYYFKPDTATTTACTGGCAKAWPPLLATGTQAPTSATPLSGKLTALQDANGNQVQYNGHFLYTFSGDSAPGQTNGEGIGGVWFVATTTLA